MKEKAPPKQVFYPRSMQELFAAWNRFPDAVPYAGGTQMLRDQESRRFIHMPPTVISLDYLEELKHITRTERYIEIGAMVTLNEIIKLGKIICDALSESLREIGTPQVRNLATLGGNICASTARLNSVSPLIALDARYETRIQEETRWIPAARFTTLAPQELLTRIRIPLEIWNFSRFKRFPMDLDASGLQGGGGCMTCTVRAQKDILSDIRLVFAGETVLRHKGAEDFLSGTHLPLDEKERGRVLELWREAVDQEESISPGMKDRILNFIESCLSELMNA